MTIRQQIINHLKTDLLKISTANGYTRSIGKVTFGKLSLSDVNEFDAVQSCFSLGADVTDDSKNESVLRVQLPVLIQVFIESKNDIDNENLITDEAEVWLQNFDWFFYGGNTQIDIGNRSALKNIPGVSRYTIIVRDPMHSSHENRQSAAVLLRIYINQFK